MNFRIGLFSHSSLSCLLRLADKCACHEFILPELIRNGRFQTARDLIAIKPLWSQGLPIFILAIQFKRPDLIWALLQIPQNRELRPDLYLQKALKSGDSQFCKS